jgi:hypothetical protein
MRNKRFLWLQAMLLLISVCVRIEAQDLSKYFQNTEGAFVLYDLKNDRYLRYNERRCRERFTPFSTFKIPNSIIGLRSHPRPAHQPDQTDSDRLGIPAQAMSGRQSCKDGNLTNSCA